MTYSRKALLIGIAIMAVYCTGAIIAYFIYSSAAYSAYESEGVRLEAAYQSELKTVPGNLERRRQIEAEFYRRWAKVKADIETRKDDALKPLRAEYWKRMERAKMKRDSSDTFVQIRGSYDESVAAKAWSTDSEPIITFFARKETDARDAFENKRDAAIAAFEKENPTKEYLIKRRYPSTSLLPSMSKAEFRQALELGGFGLMAIYIAIACVQAVRLADKERPIW
jgi:hypothetical protein